MEYKKKIAKVKLSAFAVNLADLDEIFNIAANCQIVTTDGAAGIISCDNFGCIARGNQKLQGIPTIMMLVTWEAFT